MGKGIEFGEPGPDCGLSIGADKTRNRVKNAVNFELPRQKKNEIKCTERKCDKKAADLLQGFKN
jgi:hypothetical protein